MACVGHGEAVKAGELQPALGNEGVDRTVDITATGKTSVEWIVDVLPPGQALVVTTTMFEEDIEPTRFEYPAHVLKRTANIRDSAQRPGRDDTIKPASAQGSISAVPWMQVTGI